MMQNKMELSTRMKEYYENAYKIVLPWRLPIIIRLDGCHFHTLTRGTQKPFDANILRSMDYTALYLCENIQGAELAYVQSDEISLLLYPWKTNESQPWFNNELQKIVSVSAGMASAQFTMFYIPKISINGKIVSQVATFDSRAFVLPEYEVVNYFIWRQQDWIRNSVQMFAQSMFSTKELHGKNNEEIKGMCLSKGVNWNELANSLKYGRCITKVMWSEKKPYKMDNWFIDDNIPIFKDDRNYISALLPTVTNTNFEYIAAQDNDNRET